MKNAALHTVMFAICGLLAASVPAFAQNGSSPGSMEIYPTFHAAGVRLGYAGDDNQNATARLQWRKQGSGTWQDGVAMSRISNSRWAGSVLWLEPDSPYEVRAVIEDPDGGSSATGSTRTRRTLPEEPSGRTWWVAVNGDDDNTGGPGSPLATLQVAANQAQPGDEIRVRPGIYYQTLNTPRSGTATAPIHLVADGPGVRIDGSDPAYLHRTDWRDEGGGVYSAPYAEASNRLVTAGSSRRLYSHASVAALRAGANGVAQGFVIEGGRLYVRLEDGGSPLSWPIHVARSNVGITIDGSYWHVKDLQIRYFGTGVGGGGIHLVGGTGNWIEGNHVYSFGHRGIYIRSGSSNNLIERNWVRDGRVGMWPWDATKSHIEEITGISNRGGRGNVIRSNLITGTFDGLDANAGEGDEDIAADADYYDNWVAHCGDDAIETDTVSGINLRLWQNVFNGNFGGISLAPIYQGPEYVLYNQITSFRKGGFKFSNNSSGAVWICHNTVTSHVDGKAAVWPSGPYSNMHFRNNILVGNDIGAVNDDAGESQDGNDFNGDLLYSTGSTLFRWKGSNYSSLSSLRSGTGFEQNGQSGAPLFISTTTGNYGLLPGSPGVDDAIRLPGINDIYRGSAPDMGAYEQGDGDGLGPLHSSSAQPWLMAGLVPQGLEDEDAIEAVPGETPAVQSSPPAAPEAAPGPARLALRLDAPRPNPIRGAATLTFAIPREAHVALRLYDVAGRTVVELANGVYPPGEHTWPWDGRDGGGRAVPAGIYLMRLETLDQTRTTRVMVAQ